jgi:hypothetical protein
MNIFMEDDDLKEIPAVPPSEDLGRVIVPTQGKREEEISILQKEIAALDAQLIGPTEAARIHDVSIPSASKWSNGKDMGKEDEVRSRILSRKFDIQDTAVTKLMETLDILDPSDLVKTREKVMVINSLGNLVDKMTARNEVPAAAVHLHMYMPNQKAITDYGKVIDVIDSDPNAARS